MNGIVWDVFSSSVVWDGLSVSFVSVEALEDREIRWCIDSVHFDANMTPGEVRRSLVDHDGYPEDIRIRPNDERLFRHMLEEEDEEDLWDVIEF